MKPIFPALKERKRYLLFRILSDSGVNKQQCGDAVRRACSRALGELNYAKAGVLFLKETYKAKKKTGIIRVNTKYVDEVKLALASIEEIAGGRATFDVVKVSGLLNKLK